MTKGSFTAMIGLIVLILLSNAIIQMQATQQTEKTGNVTGLLNELPLLVQKINWVVDKRISDDLADYAFSTLPGKESCTMDSGFSPNLNLFIQGLAPSGISCSFTLVNSSYSGSNPYDVISNYSISCSAAASNGNISFSQDFSSKKRINPVSVIGSCTITVTDFVSGVVEVQQTQTTT